MVSLATFGEALRTARTSHQPKPKSLRDVARIADFNYSYLSKVEKGTRTATAEIVAGYDKALDTNLLAIFKALACAPATLPDVVAVVGRDRELTKIIGLLSSDAATVRARNRGSGWVVLVSGPYGVGKTALAVTAARASRDHYPDGVLYLDLDGYGPPDHQPVTPMDALGEMLQALGIRSVGRTLAERVRQYRTALASRPNREHRVLIVLDNARDARQVQPLLPGADATATVLVTSRSRMTDLISVQKSWLPLEPLSSSDSAEVLTYLLAGRHPCADDQEAITTLIEMCGGLPLVLRLMAEWVATTEPNISRIDLVRQAVAFNAHDLPSHIKDHLAGELSALSDEAARLVHLAGVWRCGHVHMSASALAALTGRPIAHVRRVITELLNAGVLQEVSRGRYGMTVLASGYASLSTDRNDDDRSTAARRIVSWYLHSTKRATAELDRGRIPSAAPVVDGVEPKHHRSAAEALEWLWAERDAIAEASKVAFRHCLLTECWQLAVSLKGWLEREPSLVALWIDVIERGYIAAVRGRTDHLLPTKHRHDIIAIATVQTHWAVALRHASWPGATANPARAYERALAAAHLAVERWQLILSNVREWTLPEYFEAYQDEAGVRALVARGEAEAHRVVAELHLDHMFLTEARAAVESSLTALGPPDQMRMADRLTFALAQTVYATILRLTPEQTSLQMAEMRALSALDQLGHLGGVDRPVSDAQRELAEIYATWAKRHQHATKYLSKAAAAIEASVKAIRVTSDQPTEVRLRKRQVSILVDLADHLVGRNDYQAAEDVLRRCVSIANDLADTAISTQVCGRVNEVQSLISRESETAGLVDGPSTSR